MIIDTETIETVAGDYTVEWVAEDYAEQPYDYGWTLYVHTERSRGGSIDVTDAEEKNAVPDIVQAQFGERYDFEKRSGHAILRYLSLLGLRARLVDADYRLVDDIEHADGVVIAPSDIPPEHVEKSFDDFLETWRAWAEGDVFGWRVLDPGGNEIDSVWGYYGYCRERAYTLSEARAAAEYDARERLGKSNLVGAGFIELI